MIWDQWNVLAQIEQHVRQTNPATDTATQDDVDEMVQEARRNHVAEQRKALYDDTRRELHAQRRRNVETLTRKRIATDLGTLRALYTVINLGLNRRELVRRRALHLARLRGLVLFLRSAKDWGGVNVIEEVLKSAGQAPPCKSRRRARITWPSRLIHGSSATTRSR